MTTMPHLLRTVLISATLAGCHSITAHAQDGDDNSIVCWGSNAIGQCNVPEGVGGPGNPVLEVSAAEGTTAVVLADGSVACWGNNSSGQCDVPEGIGTPSNPVRQIATGSNFFITSSC